MSFLTNPNDRWHLVLLGDKDILAHVVSLRHPEIQRNLHEFEWVHSAELWGLLRDWDIERMLITNTDPVLIQVNYPNTAYYGYSFEGRYKIWAADYLNFLHYYCVQQGSKHKVRWAQEGF